MMQIDSAILATDKVICKNISRFDDSERGLLSQNILSQLRNFVEYIADKVYANGSDLDPKPCMCFWNGFVATATNLIE